MDDEFDWEPDEVPPLGMGFKYVALGMICLCLAVEVTPWFLILSAIALIRAAYVEFLEDNQ
jgi:hypothetical protein